MTVIQKGLGRVTGQVAPTNFVIKAVTVLAAATTGTATVKAGSKILSIVASGAADQIVKNVAIAGTVLTVTLNVAATANNTYNVTVIE